MLVSVDETQAWSLFYGAWILIIPRLFVKTSKEEGDPRLWGKEGEIKL